MTETSISELEERVDRLEGIVQEFVTAVGIEFNKLYHAQMRTEAELQAFKDEMRGFKLREQNRERNRQWGQMAIKLGTLVEDLVAPSLPRLIEEKFGEPVLDLMIRRKRRLADGRVWAFDALALTAGLLFLNSTKATLRQADVDGFTGEIEVFRAYFPEYARLPLSGVLAALGVEDGLVRYAERQGFLVLAVGDRLMEIRNTSDF